MEPGDNPKTAPREEDRAARIPDALPLLHVRDMVVYPEMKIPLFVGRERSVRALEEAAAHDRHLMLVAQRSPAVDEPTPDELYDVGAAGRTMEPLRLPDGTLRIVVEGMVRARIVEYLQADPFYMVRVEVLPERQECPPEVEALMGDAVAELDRAVQADKGIPPEALESVRKIEKPGELADAIACFLSIDIAAKQEILETMDPKARVERILRHLEREREAR